ncbi:MAG TPA: hypothetical protein PLJ35_13995 [Anaerolineae bacterium]|nr:hypothetical protein [Anaerolineae bacterium]HOQ99927.1 hypothetical protein [Anaerolineae bacterium]HPL26844.1 hypothetical protein [Anaerolineae bacterium]
MAADTQIESVRQRVASDVEAAADDLRRLALSEEADLTIGLRGVIQRLSEQLEDALLALETAESGQAAIR